MTIFVFKIIFFLSWFTGILILVKFINRRLLYKGYKDMTIFDAFFVPNNF